MILAGSAFTFSTARSWQIADGYNIGFSNDEAGGIFKDLKGDIVLDENNPATAKFDEIADGFEQELVVAIEDEVGVEGHADRHTALLRERLIEFHGGSQQILDA